jgi:hypothetical protein
MHKRRFNSFDSAPSLTIADLFVSDTASPWWYVQPKRRGVLA